MGPGCNFKITLLHVAEDWRGQGGWMLVWMDTNANSYQQNWKGEMILYFCSAV